MDDSRIETSANKSQERRLGLAVGALRKLINSALTASLIALLGVYLGDTLANDQVVATQTKQFEEDRAREARAERRKVYGNFLVEADAYSEVVDPPKSIAKKLRDDVAGIALDPTLKRWVDTLVERRKSYIRARDEVFVYGSDEAWQAADRVDRLFSDDEEILYDGFRNFEYQATVEKFRSVICRELSLEPHAKCERSSFLTQPLRE
jgi:hypothetical protein